jgi:hypothetical protein
MRNAWKLTAQLPELRIISTRESAIQSWQRLSPVSLLHGLR